jgi:hypothetical protein
VAGLGHASMGNLDLELLGQLLIGLFLEFILKYVEEKCLICSLKCYCNYALFVGYGLVFLDQKTISFDIRNEMVFIYSFKNCLAKSAKELFSSIIKVLSRTSVISLRTAQLVSSLQSAHFHRNCDWHKAVRLSTF